MNYCLLIYGKQTHQTDLTNALVYLMSTPNLISRKENLENNYTSYHSAISTFRLYHFFYLGKQTKQCSVGDVVVCTIAS